MRIGISFVYYVWFFYFFLLKYKISYLFFTILDILRSIFYFLMFEVIVIYGKKFLGFI